MATKSIPFRSTAAFLIAGSLFYFSSCRDTQQVQPGTPLLTFHVGGDYAPAGTENWIIIHNQNGSVVTYRRFYNGEVVTLHSRTTANSPISVTFLNYEYGLYPSHTLTTYLGVTPGTDWTLNKSVTFTHSDSVSGRFNIRLPDYKASSYYSVTGRNGLGNYYMNNDYNGFFLNSYIYQEADKYIFFWADPVGNFKYSLIENPTDNTTLSLPLSDMHDFDKIVYFKTPVSGKASVRITAVDNDRDYRNWDGYLLNGSTIPDMAPGDLRGGYLNMFDHHSTHFSLETGGQLYSYHKEGAPPSGNITFQILDSPLVGDNSYSNFSVTSAVPFTFRASEWSHSEPSMTMYTLDHATLWNVFGATSSQKITEFPAELLQRYPKLELNELEYRKTKYYTISRSYADFINSVSVGNAEDVGAETYAIEVAAQ